MTMPPLFVSATDAMSSTADAERQMSVRTSESKSAYDDLRFVLYLKDDPGDPPRKS